MSNFIRSATVATFFIAPAVPAMAMNCEEFMVMSEDGRKGVVMGVMIERDSAGGREAARDDARRTDEVYEGMVEHCKTNSEEDFLAAMDAMHPSASN
ncbi:HdeA/HdeB family chaperone [Roseovarius sp. D0-M9]|uniref:HdeA/HdeB family chaperone n=1 Tax=Roseovarius sp. D0-M9 TaxID=3127117 RepID=UPI003010516B